jgi:hypothetical protein
MYHPNSQFLTPNATLLVYNPISSIKHKLQNIHITYSSSSEINKKESR